MGLYRGMTLVGSLVAVSILSLVVVAMLDLQVSIQKSQFDQRYAVAANLLAAEGLELVRAMYVENKRSGANPWDTGLATGTFAIDYNTSIANGLSASNSSNCRTRNLNASCALSFSNNAGYLLDSNGDSIYRFIEVDNPTTPTNLVRVTSTVIVKNPASDLERVYTTFGEIYNIDLALE